jgi:hypothetical protein
MLQTAWHMIENKKALHFVPAKKMEKNSPSIPFDMNHITLTSRMAQCLGHYSLVGKWK